MDGVWKSYEERPAEAGEYTVRVSTGHAFSALWDRAGGYWYQMVRNYQGWIVRQPLDDVTAWFLKDGATHEQG